MGVPVEDDSTLPIMLDDEETAEDDTTEPTPVEEEETALPIMLDEDDTADDSNADDATTEPVMVGEDDALPIMLDEDEEVAPVETPEVEFLAAGDDAFDNLLADVGNKPVVLEFQYPGCIPCEEIAGDYKAARDANPDIVFKKVNVYEQMSLLEEYSIKAMPSFVIWVNGEE